MPDMIKDGKGRGYSAEVSPDNHLVTHAYAEGFKEFAVISGDAYNINTGAITLTNDTTTPVLYVENTGDNEFVIPQIIYLLRATTGGAGDCTVNVYKNITGGTIVSGATNVDMKQSRNVGINRLPSGNIYKGATGNTRTGGTQILSTLVGTSVKVLIEVGDLIIPKGKNICFEIIPPTGNTSMSMMFINELWIRTTE